MDNKITEEQVVALHVAMQTIIDGVLENQYDDCNIINDFLAWQYSVSEEDIIYILKELGIDTIEKQVIKEIPVREFFYKTSK